MKKGEKENGVPVACIPERAVANVAVAPFLERAAGTSDLTTRFILPHGHFIPQIQLHSRRRRRPSAAARSPHTAPDPRFNAGPAPDLNAARDAAPDPDLNAAPDAAPAPPTSMPPWSPDHDLDAACPSLVAGTRVEHACSSLSPTSA